ncbi:MAG: carboxypeptidase-like regulatory domain-containing protein [Rhodothermales bacterium]
MVWSNVSGWARQRVYVCGSVLLLMVAFTPSVWAQTQPVYTLVARDVPLREALEEIVRITQIDILFSSDLVANRQASCVRQDQPVDVLLRCVLRGTGLDFVRSSSGAYVVIEAVETAPRYADVSGQVVDAETGAPLPFANVLLADAGAGTMADEAGMFRFARVLAGTHRIRASYLGYRIAAQEIRLEPGTPRRVEVALEPEAVVIEPIVVDGRVQERVSATLGRGFLGEENLSAVRGVATADVARQMSRLTGVSMSQPVADLHIQGGAVGEHLTLLDGAAVRNPVSLGRHLGAFSPLALSRLDVKRAGFGAAHGSHLSGVVAAYHDLQMPGEPALAVSIDPVSANGKLRLGWQRPNGYSATFMAAFRRSLWDVYEDRGIATTLDRWNAPDPFFTTFWLREPVAANTLAIQRNQPTVRFTDTHVAGRFTFGPLHVLTASLYHGRNDLDVQQTVLYTPDPSTAIRDDDTASLLGLDNAYGWDNWAGHLRHHALLGSRSMLTLEATGSWHTSNYTYRQARVMADERIGIAAQEPDLLARLEASTVRINEYNDLGEFAAGGTWNYAFAPEQHLELGLRAEYTTTDFELGNLFIAPFRYEAALWQGSGHAALSLRLSGRWQAEPSVRTTWVPDRATVYAEPRLLVRYDAPLREAGALAVRIGGGLYRQFVNTFELSSASATAVVPSLLFWLPTDASLAPPRVLHVTAGTSVHPDAQWRFSADVFYKHQPRLLTLDYARLLAEYPAQNPAPAPLTFQQADFISATEGRAYGGSIQVQHFGNRVQPAVRYQYTHAERRYPSRFDNRMLVTPWTIPHRLDLDLAVPLNDAVSLDMSGRTEWGRAWGFHQGYYDYLSPGAIDGLDLSQPEADTLPAAVHLDLSLRITVPGVGTAHALQVSILNVLDAPLVYDRVVDGAIAPTPTDRRLPGRQLAISLRIGR